jgi:hypothetical protein
MKWLVVTAFLAAAAAFVLTRAVRPRRSGAGAPPPAAMSVTLSVLPTGTAVVVLDVETEAPSAALSRLVEHAVRDAFLF